MRILLSSREHDLDQPDEPPDYNEEPVGEDQDPWEYLQDDDKAAEASLRNREDA